MVETAECRGLADHVWARSALGVAQGIRNITRDSIPAVAGGTRRQSGNGGAEPLIVFLGGVHVCGRSDLLGCAERLPLRRMERLVDLGVQFRANQKGEA